MRRPGWMAGAVLVAGLVGVGCSSSDDDAATGTDQEESTAAADEAAAGADIAAEAGAADASSQGAVPAIASPAQLVNAGRSVIRTAEVTLEAEDVGVAAREAVDVAERAGGFLADEQSSLDGDPSSRLVLKVLPERFVDALDELAALGEVTSKQVGSDDVTEVVVDLEGRLGAARASVERLRQLLGQAADVPQVVAVESELARREGEVESLAGQLRALESQVDLATITLQLTMPPAAQDPSASEDIPGFWSGLRTGGVAFVNVLGGAATVVGFALPFLALALVVGIPTLWWRRRRVRTAV